MDPRGAALDEPYQTRAEDRTGVETTADPSQRTPARERLIGWLLAH